MTPQLPRVSFFMPAIDRGGITSALGRIVRALSATGRVNLDVVTGTPRVPGIDMFGAAATVVGLEGGRVFPAFGPLRVEKTRKSLSTFNGLRSYLKAARPHALVTFQGAVTAAAAVGVSGFDGRLIIRESSTPSLALKFPNGLFEVPKRFAKGWSYRRADAVIAISRGAREDVSKYLGVPIERITVIHNPVPELDSSAHGAAERPPHEWMSPGHALPVVVTVARLVESKGISTVIRAVAEIRKTRPIRLVIVGDGPAKSRLQSLATDVGLESTVDFVGWVSNAQEFIKCADVFAFGTRFEGLGNVLLEALALRTPVVSCDAPAGPRDVLDDGRCGQLVAVDDFAGMAADIAKYLEDPALVAAHLDRAQEHLRTFSPEHIAESYLKVLGLSST